MAIEEDAGFLKKIHERNKAYAANKDEIKRVEQKWHEEELDALEWGKNCKTG